MQRQTFVLAALAMLTAPIAIPTDAVAASGRPGGATNIQELCRDLVATGDIPGLSMGECVSLNLSSDKEGGAFVAHRCDNWRDDGELELAGFRSYSDCIRNFSP